MPAAGARWHMSMETAMARIRQAPPATPPAIAASVGPPITPSLDPPPEPEGADPDANGATTEVSPDGVWVTVAVVSTADSEVMLYVWRNAGVKTDAMFEVNEAAAEAARELLVPWGSVTATLAMMDPGWKEKT